MEDPSRKDGDVLGINVDDEGDCRFVVNSVLSSLDDDEDDPELTPASKRSSGGGGSGGVGIGIAQGAVGIGTATPSVDSGFGGGSSPPPSAAGLDSASGGGSPSPTSGASKYIDLKSNEPFKVPNLHAIEGTSLFDGVQLQSKAGNLPPAAGAGADLCDNQSFDIATLEQAINVIKIGMAGMPGGDTANPTLPVFPQQPLQQQQQIPVQGPMFVGPGGDQPESNFSQNLRLLASIQDQMPPHDRYSFSPPFGRPQMEFDGYGMGPRQSTVQCRDPMRMMKQQQHQHQQIFHQHHQQIPRPHHQHLQRYHSNEVDYGRGSSSCFRFGSTSPFEPQPPAADFMGRGPQRTLNFRGSNCSLNEAGWMPTPASGGGQPSSSSSSTSGGGNGNLMLDSLGISNMSRLEINKGGLGKNPYASLVSTLSSFQSNPMQIRCKFGQLGQGQGQFNSPHGFCLGRKEEIVVADTHNHRIQVFDTAGNFRFMFGNQGKAEGCLWYPRKVAVLKHDGNFVVCDRGGERSRMQIFNQYGQFSHAISIRFIDIVAGLAISQDNHIVAVDSVTPTIFVLSEDGKLLRYHECSEFMKEPSDIGIYDRNYYICDFKDHNVVVVSEDGRLLRKIGSDRITCFPNGIDISDAGDVLVGDSHGNKFHVAVFDKDSVLASQFECPNVKVSRCCGLKITSEGYIVTLAKNNHHVLVLNTIYLP